MLCDSDQTRDLLSQVRRGKKPAFDQLFELHRDYLKSVIEMHLHPNSRFDASDVIQETHLNAHQNFEQYLQRQPMPFKLWLRKTAQQRLAKMLRLHTAERRDVNRQKPIPEEHSSMMIALKLVGQLPSPSEIAARRQTIDQISRAVNELSQEDREVLLLRQVEGLSHREIAEILDIDEAAARQRYGRVLLRFQKLLIKNGVTQSDV